MERHHLAELSVKASSWLRISHSRSSLHETSEAIGNGGSNILGDNRYPGEEDDTHTMKHDNFSRRRINPK